MIAKNSLKRSLPLAAILAAFVIAAPAQALAAATKACSPTVGGFLNFPTWYKYIIDDAKTNSVECVLKFDVKTGIPGVLMAVFEIVLRIGGLLAVGMIIYGGIKYIISQGEPEKTKGARTTIVNALVGLVISLSAVAIVNLIGKNL